MNELDSLPKEELIILLLAEKEKTSALMKEITRLRRINRGLKNST
jgi:hypothetical protein